MQTLVLTSLIDVPISIVVSNKDTLPFRPGNQFELPVVLINKGETPLGWSQQNPLNLSYRWLSEDGELLERDGRRTTIPVTPLVPSKRVEVEMAGISPEDAGSYQLQLSLVLEGVHWACDVASSGWIQRVTNVTPAPAWPADLKVSRGGRALRGAMVAADLARQLEKRTFAVKEAPTESETTTASDLSSVQEPKSFFHPMRNWLRALLGVRGLEQQLVDVIALASSQEQRARELENQISTFKEELQVDLKLLKDRATRPGKSSFDPLQEPRVGVEKETRRNLASDAEGPLRKPKRSSSRSQISRKPAR